MRRIMQNMSSRRRGALLQKPPRFKAIYTYVCTLPRYMLERGGYQDPAKVVCHKLLYPLDYFFDYL